MHIAVKAQDPGNWKGEMLALLVADKALFYADDSRLKRSARAFQTAVARDIVKEPLVSRSSDGRPAFVGLFAAKHTEVSGESEQVRAMAAKAVEYAKNHGIRTLAIPLNTDHGGTMLRPLVDGLVIGGYEFNRYRDKKNPADGLSVEVLVPKESLSKAKAECDVGALVNAAVNLARDLSNDSSSVKYPALLADYAKKVAQECGLKCTVHDEKALAKDNRVGILAVGQGSVHPPRLISIEYAPAKKSDLCLALVGKGITFDSGGISLKPGDGMWDMKGDMSGASAVIHTMKVISELKPSVRVVGIIPSAENLPGGNATRPGDIITYRNGKSVEIQNTDAEGRLILADALIHAGEVGATHIIDIATLTGACARALGPDMAGIMGNDPGMIQAFIKTGEAAGELYWELPLFADYRKMLDSTAATLKNIGGALAGAQTAGLFLKEFVPDGAKWVHLDIAGTFTVDKPTKYFLVAGATGYGVRSLTAFAQSFVDVVSYA
jgi:leucyl aminopeptidase